VQRPLPITLLTPLSCALARCLLARLRQLLIKFAVTNRESSVSMWLLRQPHRNAREKVRRSLLTGFASPGVTMALRMWGSNVRQ